MSEGYERRPEERASILQRWQAVLLPIASACLIIANCGWLAEMQISRRLRAENADLQAQLDYFTCRVQLEPIPVPEQVGGPTLIDGESP